MPTPATSAKTPKSKKAAAPAGNEGKEATISRSVENIFDVKISFKARTKEGDAEEKKMEGDYEFHIQTKHVDNVVRKVLETVASGLVKAADLVR